MKYHHPVPLLEIHYGENCHTFKFCSDFINLQGNQSSVTESLASSMGVCSQKSCHCVGAGLSSRLANLWASEPAVVACGHELQVLAVQSMEYFAQEMCVHALALLACSSLSSVQCFWMVW